MNKKQFAFLESAEAYEYKVLNESKESDGKWSCTIEVPLQRLDYVNNNRRNYTKSLMAPVIKNVQPLVQQRHLVGEYGHPVFEAGVMPTTEQYIRRITTIDPRLMSHMFTKLWIDGDYVMGHVKTLHTKWGQDLTNFLVLDRGTIGFSLRSVGGVERVNGVDVVKPQGFVFITYDAVINPSNNIAKFNPNTTSMVSSPMMESTVGAVCVDGVCALQESVTNPNASPAAKYTALRSKLAESFEKIKK